MFNPASKYYNVNRMLLLACGLWPYQRSRFIRRIKAAVFLSVVLSFIALQFTTFIDAECTINLVTKVLSIVLPMTVVVLKHVTFFFNSEKMKHLMDLMWHHWTVTQNEQELAILEKYARFIRQFTIVALHVFFFGIVVVTVGHMFPIIQDVVSPLNSSRPRRFYILTKYPVDEDRYFFPILTHAILTLSLGSIMVLGAGCMLVAYMTHASAMFKIAGYRIGDAVFENTALSCPKDYVVYERIISGVLIHREAINFSELIFSSFRVPYFVVIASGVASLTLNMFQIFIALVTHDVSDLVTNLMFIGVQFLYLYVGNYAGQIIMDHFAEVFDMTYHSFWYTAPISAQKLLLFVMQRTTKNFSVVFGGIFIISLKGFSTIASMSISYFTVICSVMYSD